MKAKELLEKLLRAYRDYYDVTRFDGSPGTDTAPGTGAAPGTGTVCGTDAPPHMGAACRTESATGEKGTVPGGEPVLNPARLFAAEAVFHSHEEQYFLVRAARIAEAESHEYVFFALRDTLTAARLRELSDAAWEQGTARTVPHKDHRNTDIALIVLADHIEPEALALVPKLRRYRGYRFGLQGWSHFLLFAVEASTGRCAWNRQGQRLRKLIQSNIREL